MRYLYCFILECKDNNSKKIFYIFLKCFIELEMSTIDLNEE